MPLVRTVARADASRSACAAPRRGRFPSAGLRRGDHEGADPCPRPRATVASDRQSDGRTLDGTAHRGREALGGGVRSRATGSARRRVRADRLRTHRLPLRLDPGLGPPWRQGATGAGARHPADPTLGRRRQGLDGSPPDPSTGRGRALRALGQDGSSGGAAADDERPAGADVAAGARGGGSAHQAGPASAAGARRDPRPGRRGPLSRRAGLRAGVSSSRSPSSRRDRWCGEDATGATTSMSPGRSGERRWRSTASITPGPSMW